MKKIVIVTANKEVKEEISRKLKEMKDLEPGSEKYLEDAKALNQLAEASQKLKVDVLPWITLATNVGLTALVIIAGQTSIIDTRPIAAIKNIFKK